MNTERKTGYYWVKTINGWEIGEFTQEDIILDSFWVVGGTIIFTESRIIEIDERQILRESEVNGKNLQLQEHNLQLQNLRKSQLEKLLEAQKKNKELSENLLEMIRDIVKCDVLAKLSVLEPLLQINSEKVLIETIEKETNKLREAKKLLNL